VSRIDIQRWYPQKWDQVVGNSELVEHYKTALRHFLTGVVKGPSTLILGSSSSGKTGVTKLLVQCLMCKKLDTVTLNPCGAENCKWCKFVSARLSLTALETFGTEANVHFVPIDCTRITADRLEEEVRNVEWSEGVGVVYLDEVHGLHRPGNPLERKLLKPIQETSSTWIASSTTMGELVPEFLNRFPHKIKTELPTKDALVEWLADRCESWKIDWDDAATLLLLAQRANRIPGLALQVLEQADMGTPRCVTRKLVEEHVFYFGE
jgi:hypothetical protein